MMIQQIISCIVIFIQCVIIINFNPQHKHDLHCQLIFFLSNWQVSQQWVFADAFDWRANLQGPMTIMYINSNLICDIWSKNTTYAKQFSLIYLHGLWCPIVSNHVYFYVCTLIIFYESNLEILNAILANLDQLQCVYNAIKSPFKGKVMREMPQWKTQCLHKIPNMLPGLGLSVWMVLGWWNLIGMFFQGIHDCAI